MLKKIALVLAAYPLCWIMAHCIVMLSRGDGLSLGYLIPYFKYVWSLSGGELPSFIWLVSLVLYALFLASWFVVSWRRRGRAA